MSNLIKIITGRRSVRRFHPDPIPRDMIERLLEAAVWAPSAHNRQPWRFAVITSSEVKHRLAAAMGDRLRADLAKDGVPADAIEKDATRSASRLNGAPLLILLCLSMADMDSYPDRVRQTNEQLMAVQSTAMAGQNLLLAAHEMGLGGCWMCAPLFSQAVVRECLNLPGDWQPQALITLGKPAEIKRKTRRPFQDLTRFY